MENAFFYLAEEVRKKEFGMHSDIVAAAKAFYKVVQASDSIKTILFKDQLYDEILKIKRLMSENKDSIIQSYHDKIFKNILKMSKPVLGITRIFGEFVKGMTYFKNEEYNLEKPVYHRLMSCGDGSLAFRRMYQQCKNDTSKRRIAKRRIETCYIERLIYDQLYKTQSLHFPSKGDDEKTQDEGHKNWLEQTKADFQTCFPNVDLQIELEYRGKYPINLKIERYKKNKLVSIERYTKDRYEDAYSIFVECSLDTFTDKKQKIQTFEKPRRYIRSH